jgi:hypothetical protein
MESKVGEGASKIFSKFHPVEWALDINSHFSCSIGIVEDASVEYNILDS